MLLVYTPKITNRNKYIFRLIFHDILGIKTNLTTTVSEYKEHTGAKMNYSLNKMGDEVFFHSRNLLFETGISEQNVLVTEYEGCKIFYSTVKNSALPFDPFAASFYLVSRYEEYFPHKRDEYERFDDRESIAFKNGFLQKPVINIWAQWIKDILLKKFPSMHFEERKYEYISTIDIDNAYAYREKGLVRTIGGFAKAFSKRDFKDIAERIKVLSGFKKDPYDTYDLQLEIQNRYKLRPIYFFLLGDYGVNDKNVSIESKKFQSLIKKIGDYADVGVHPSFGSNKNPEQLKIEIERLSKTLHREITKSRQHFLKLTLPHTYRTLIDFDITDDYTMGYASQLGFRAGICTPFFFYDLDMEAETKLKVHPFAVMEATLKYYMKLAPQEALEHIKPLINEVRQVNGTFISLWHNEILSNEKQWTGWRDLYEEMVKLATDQ
jgi:hypothetical protein